MELTIELWAEGALRGMLVVDVELDTTLAGVQDVVDIARRRWAVAFWNGQAQEVQAFAHLDVRQGGEK